MLEHTSLEANKETTPMGMKTALTSKNTEITCTGRERLINFSIHNDNITWEIQKMTNYKAYPSWCENWFACWKFLLSKPRI
jgi:hypothetical protein